MFSWRLRRRRPRTGSCLGANRSIGCASRVTSGLERVAKARGDPALVGPVTAALEALGAIYARLKADISVLYASRANLLVPVDLVVHRGFRSGAVEQGRLLLSSEHLLQHFQLLVHDVLAGGADDAPMPAIGGGR